MVKRVKNVKVARPVVNDVIKNLQGVEIRIFTPGTEPSDNDPVLTIAAVLADAALAANGHVITPEEASSRLAFAREAAAAKVGDVIAVPLELIEALDKAVAQYYPMLISGTVHEVLK